MCSRPLPPLDARAWFLNEDPYLLLDGGGAEGIRTPDPHNAIVVLYQLSYDPNRLGDSNEARALVKSISTPSRCAETDRVDP
jgi:hypothetical protein